MMEDLSMGDNKVSGNDHKAAGELASWLGVKMEAPKHS
jgi:hypothetical protein